MSQPETHEQPDVRKRPYTLSIPAFLQEELDKTDWEELDTDTGDGGELPIFINGLLAEEDPELGDHCFDVLDEEIGQAVYKATYKVGEILATLLPRYTPESEVHTRVVKFLFLIMSRLTIRKGKDAYENLTTKLQASIPAFYQRAAHPDDKFALEGIYLLLHAGRTAPETVVFLWKIYNNTALSTFKRSYALFTLAILYVETDQSTTLITEFSAIWESTEEKLLRLILAAHLVMAAEGESKTPWIMELIEVFIHPAPLKQDFFKLNPYTYSYHIEEYILGVLRYIDADKQEHKIAPVLAMLPEANILTLTTLFDALFSILFWQRASLENITPTRKQALLLSADIVDKNPGVVNHAEIFRKYQLPYDATQLRQLAG
ncbi:hypothetical protein SAMN05421788_107278 [Filimonas lacunae]|uniref:Uncharacterized protein n=1 Tax=Filimonas lacunae TaxID=477680 RepID=A0A173MGS5_9BACT|nr:hypothetical protein [Filimonas lacunae]BAV06618.1 hypothetical protein FLA_2637 [Filimonas lacunae]SIT27605.1 hypothetical protein SAMN05421788_107278 [Filimonas lacunae]